MWLSVSIAMAAAVASHLVARRIPVTASLVGDENEYVWRSRQPDPFQPEPFLRMPLFPAIGRFAVEAGLDPVRWLAAVGAIASVVTVGLAAAAAHLLGGGVAAVGATAILLLTTERHVLARRRWPDPLLGCWTSALFLALVADGHPVAIGAILALAAATRIDALVMTPATAVASWVAGVALISTESLMLIGVPALAVAAITVHNGLRYDLWLPDTTFRFNVALARAEAQNGASTNDERISAAVERWDPARGQMNPVVEQSRPPRTDVLRGVVRRFVTSLGPDVFVREHVLSTRPSRRVTAALSFAAPTTAIVAVAVTGRLNGAYGALIPVVALMVLQAAFHTTTRFRQAFLPVIGCVAAVGVVRTFEHPATDIVDLVTVGAAVVVGCTLLLRSRPRRDVHVGSVVHDYVRSR